MNQIFYHTMMMVAWIAEKNSDAGTIATIRKFEEYDKLNELFRKPLCLKRVIRCIG